MADASSIRLTILGSGAAFTACGCNASYLVDDRVLVDCGAPVQVLLPRAGVAPSAVDVVLLTHFHADHTFMLPIFLGARALAGELREGLVIAGPPGTREYVHRVLSTGFGSSLTALIDKRLQPEWVVLQDGMTATIAGYTVGCHAVTHSTGPSLAYTVSRPGAATIGFSGDSTLNAGLRRVVASSHVMVCECTGWDAPTDGGHLWRGEVEQLIAQNPSTRFVLSHLNNRGEMRGAFMAHDLLSLDVEAPRG